MDIQTILKFKQDHPGNYWVRMLALCFSMVFLLMWADQAGADIDIFDINAGTADLNYQPGDDAQIAICPSNRWYFPFMNNDGDFNVSWSDNNGTTWDNVTVQSEGWKGETLMAVQGIRTWVNNTTVIILRTEGADNAYDTYLFYLWGENDPSDPAAWNYTTIHGAAGKSQAYSMSFNRSGVLYINCLYNGGIWERQWDIETGDFTGAFAVWMNVNVYPMVQVDHNDNVWYAFQNPASAKIHIYGWAGVPHIQVTNTGDRAKVGTFFITEDNTKVLTGYYQYLSTHQFVVVYETVTNTTAIMNYFQSDTDDWANNYWTTGTCYGNTVSVVQLRQESGADEFVRYRAQYDALDATWEGSETVLWTVPTTTDLCYHYATGPNSVWPKIGNVSVGRFLSGDMHYWNFKDELGGTDDYYDIIYTDSPVFTYWDWTPPPGPEPGPVTPPGEAGREYSWAVWWGEDFPCISALVIALIALVILVTFMALARRY